MRALLALALMTSTAAAEGANEISVGSQVRAEIEATISVAFETWGKLQMALAGGSQQMNLLRTAAGATANGSGGIAETAVTLEIGSTPTMLHAGAAAATFNVGDLIAVDRDYLGETGFVGSGASGAYVRQSLEVSGDVNFIRRVTLNVGRIAGIASGVLQLETPLLAGVPATGMKVNRVVGFVDREGGSFFQEWSGLFCLEGEQGDRVLYYYPRLQAMQGAAETVETLAGPLERMRLAGAFRALPVVDANDGATVVCFRSYLPA